MKISWELSFGTPCTQAPCTINVLEGSNLVGDIKKQEQVIQRLRRKKKSVRVIVKPSWRRPKKRESFSQLKPFQKRNVTQVHI